MLPPFTTQKDWIVQTSDPYRKPKEYAPPALLDAHEVVKLMHWSGVDEIATARSLGFPEAVKFKSTIVNGNVVSQVGQYREDRIQEWRQSMAKLIHATLK